MSSELMSFRRPGRPPCLRVGHVFCLSLAEWHTTAAAWGSCMTCRGSRRFRLDRTRACRSECDGHDARTAAADGHGMQFGSNATKQSIILFPLVAFDPMRLVRRFWVRALPFSSRASLDLIAIIFKGCSPHITLPSSAA
jgi:hypothetical protein